MADQCPLPVLSLCAVVTLSRHLLQVLPVDFCCLPFLGIFKNMELPGKCLLQAANHHAAAAECVVTPSGVAAFSLCLLPRLCPDTFTIDYCCLLFDI